MRNFDEKEKHSKMVKQEAAISELRKKISEAEKNNNILKENNVKVENLKKKSKFLEELYLMITPQIQCPFGH